MTNEIHPLQEAAIGLLHNLHHKENLPITKAMLTLSNGYYPSLPEILNTLKHYDANKLVIEFIKANGEIIEAAKNQAEKSKNSPDNPASETQDTVEAKNSTPNFSFKHISAYKSIKNIPLKSIEECISVELSKLCGEDLIVEIQSLLQNGDASHPDAEFKLAITPKHRIIMI